MKKNMKKVIANLNGTQTEIIIGYSIYNMERPKDKENLTAIVDREKFLSRIFHLADPKPFWKEGVELRDSEGNLIEEGTPNVYVPCDTADTYTWFEVEGMLQNVEIHHYETLEEYGKVIGNSTLHSRKLNNVEAVGVASLASNNETYKAVHRIALKYNVPMNTAQLALDVKLKQADTIKLAMGMEVKGLPEVGRSVQDAETLLDAALCVFTEKELRSRYIISAINETLKKYDIPTVVEALEKIPASSITSYRISDCNGKTACLAMELTLFIEELKERKKAA